MTLMQLAESARDCSAEARRAKYMKGDEWEAGQWASCHRQWMAILRDRLESARMNRSHLNELHARLQAAYRIRDFELVKRLTREYREAANA